MASIEDRLKNICAGGFLGWTHDSKTQFRILPHVCTIPTPREKTIYSSFRPCVLSLETYLPMPLYLVRGELATLVILLHVVPSQTERPSPHNGN